MSSNISFGLTPVDVIKLRKYIEDNKIVNNRGVLISNSQACYSMVKSFIDGLENEKVL